MDTGFILVVDDNPTNLSVISQALRSVGWNVRIAVDGEDALGKIAQHPPELILLDVQMPGIDGFEVCRRLKSNPATAEIPVIFMTALADTASKVKGLLLGAADYITKPFEQEEVLARVKIHWQLKRLTDTLEQQVADRTQSLEQAQVQLVQKEKLSALGQLVAGVAHEINNPIGCIVGNINAAHDYMNDLLRLIECYQQQFPQPGEKIDQEIASIDLDYVRADLPNLMRAMRDGSDRIKSISQSLRAFSRSDSDQKQPFQLQEGIDSTLLILRHRLKATAQRPEIQVIQNYEALPPIDCFPGQLNQVFMNILANAIDAFDEAALHDSFAQLKAQPQIITIQTQLLCDRQVEIRICDNGKGIPEAVLPRIFDHLFTTKSVGKGTGLGLAIARQIVVDKHAGAIEVQSTLNQGTEFRIRLPICDRSGNE